MRIGGSAVGLGLAFLLSACHTAPRASNVILFVGDGMGVTTVTAARILEGQRRGEPGEENRLAFEELPHVALVSTFAENQQVAESAGTMSALVTGVRTSAGILSLDQSATLGDWRGAERKRVPTLLEEAEEHGLATGLVTTARITHATPAACYAHTPHRGWESDRLLPADARASGFPDIARQLIEFDRGDGIEVALGGGRVHFLPTGVADPESPDLTGARQDGRNLVNEWKERFPDGAFVWNQAELEGIDPASTGHLLGLFEPSHMQYERDRAGEPSLTEMTRTALSILTRDPDGFFLMVEGGRIDHAHHETDAARALEETIEFSNAVRAALEMTDPSDTLVLVTADHDHVFTMGGYPTRGNDILGLVVENGARGQPRSEPALDRNGNPYPTLAYSNGPHHPAVPLPQETHGGADVPVYAGGPGSERVDGSRDQTFVYDVIRAALGW